MNGVGVDEARHPQTRTPLWSRSKRSCLRRGKAKVRHTGPSATSAPGAVRSVRAAPPITHGGELTVQTVRLLAMLA